MPQPLASAAWILAYLALILAPLLLLLLGERPRGGGLGWDFALALGYSGLAMMGLQFWLTARFKRATAPYGIDIIYVFHRYLASIAFGFLVLHALVLWLGHRAAVGSLDPRVAPAYLSAGGAALLAFALLIATSLGRKALRLDYDRWRRAHGVLAVLGVVCGLWHVLGSGSYLDSPGKRALWLGLGGSWLALFAWVRVLRPWRLRRRPWRVVAVQREPGRNWTLSLQPEQARNFAFQPGQFIWLSLGCSPWAQREHPFSISSSPTRAGPLQVTIKELGDFTSGIGRTQVGEVAYVDGPYGRFSIDSHPGARGFVFVAGGAGIAPVISMLRALADRADPRPLWLFYGNRLEERIVFGQELEELRARLELRVVHVLGEPPPDWTGERGIIDLAVMQRHLPTSLDGLHFMVCGPQPLIRLAERNAEALGVPLRRLHSEIFDLA